VKEDCSDAGNACTGGGDGSADWYDKGLKDAVTNTSCSAFMSGVCCCKLVRDGTGAVEGKLHDGDFGRCSSTLFAGGGSENNCTGHQQKCMGLLLAYRIQNQLHRL
jgi:hypothetical protein